MAEDDYVYRLTREEEGEENARPYGCVFCGNRFSREAKLKTHVKQHGGEKPYRCLMKGCGKMFAEIGKRDEHFCEPLPF